MPKNIHDKIVSIFKRLSFVVAEALAESILIWQDISFMFFKASLIRVGAVSSQKES